MKKVNKLTKKIMTLVIGTFSFYKVSAAPETITLTDPPSTKKYIAGVSFHYKQTTDGRYAYCIEMQKKRPKNVTAQLVKNSAVVDGGIVYILKNGYPEKSITGDADKDYYITQTAVWWYLDMVTGSSNLEDQFKEHGADSYDLRKYVRGLVNDAYAHRNDSIGISDTKLIINTTTTNDMTLKDNYYISSSIKATTLKNAQSYTVTLTNQPSGTKIVKSDGTEITYEKGFLINGTEDFKIKVPVSSIQGTDIQIKVSASTQGSTQYTAYEYKPNSDNMQNIVLLEKHQNNAASDLTLTISSSKVSIIKVDSNTKKPLAGAKLVLKDANGNKITSWTSTTNAHVIRNLTPGKYIIEEESAPTGYLLNKNKTTFEITDSNKDVKIKIENAPKKVVVNITKINQETNAPLKGAVLVVRDSTGKEIARFTTTEESYVLTDLPNGTYTVEEESAPAGFIKSNEKISFTIDDDHLSHQITFVNAKEVYVPDTATFSVIMLILGIGIIGTGIAFVYKNGQKA